MTVQEAIKYIESVNGSKKYQVQCKVLEQIIYYYIKANDMIKEIFKYMKRNRAYKNHVSEEEFNKT